MTYDSQRYSSSPEKSSSGGGERRELSRSKPPEPPQPPRFGKNWRFYRMQLVGIPIMIGLTLAALFGIFGEEERNEAGGNESLAVALTYPGQFRFKMIGPFSVELTNSSDHTLTGVRVTIATDYLSSFSNVIFEPAPTSLDAEWWRFELGELHSGESQLVAGELQAESFGGHSGTVVVSADDTEPVEFQISTFTFP